MHFPLLPMKHSDEACITVVPSIHNSFYSTHTTDEMSFDCWGAHRWVQSVRIYYKPQPVEQLHWFSPAVLVPPLCWLPPPPPPGCSPAQTAERHLHGSWLPAAIPPPEGLPPGPATAVSVPAPPAPPATPLQAENTRRYIHLHEHTLDHTEKSHRHKCEVQSGTEIKIPHD